MLGLKLKSLADALLKLLTDASSMIVPHAVHSCSSAAGTERRCGRVRVSQRLLCSLKVYCQLFVHRLHAVRGFQCDLHVL